MRRRSIKTPLWESQVHQTIQKLKVESKSRSLKSCDLYECVCIFISDHLKERIFSQATLCVYYQNLKSFSAWMSEAEKVTDIRNVRVSHLRKYFSYLEIVRKYKKSSLEGSQTSLMRFFRSMIFRRLIKKNPMQDFHIVARRHMNSAKILTIFDIKILLRSVKGHYQYLKDSDKLDCFSLFIHRRDLCILALCIGCGLRRGEIQRINRNHLELKRGYSQKSKAAVLTTIQRFYALFAAQGLVKTNTTANIRIKKVKKIDKTALSEEEPTSIFSAAYLKYQPYDGIIPADSRVTLERWLAARDWAIICLLICTGLRRKEIASLKTDSIDFRQRVIRIAGKGDNTYQVRERIIPVTEPIALSAVEIYLSLRPKSIFDHLFLSTHLEPLKTCGFTKVVNRMKQELFPQKCLTITQIRKSFVSLCAEKGIDPLILRQIMGHNSLATTMKYYLTVQEQQLREVWEKNF